MQQEDIDFLSRIDRNKENGSIQSVLSEGDLRSVPFNAVAKRIIMNLLNDRQAILTENKNLSNYLKKHGMYCEEAVFGENK